MIFFGVNWYDYGARFYDPQLGRFHAIDRFAENFAEWSPYHYANNNPINNIDINGDSTVVMAGANDNTFVVVDGAPTDGRGLYLRNDDGEVSLIGQTMTPYSFFDDDGNAVVGAVIDFNSTEGQDFINALIEENPSLIKYIFNARNNGDYDFKAIGEGDRRGLQTVEQYHYRGSVASDGSIGSARDFGNMGAGIVAGRKGLTWRQARAGFDAYDSYKRGSIGVEGAPTQAAQRVGFSIGQGLRTSSLPKIPKRLRP